MNKANLKSYAPQARKDFIAAVTARANLLGLSERAGKLEEIASLPQGDVTVIAGQAWPVKVHSQRNHLITRIKRDGFAQTMEAVAYTWFNRFAALRYMELHGYLDHGHRALSCTEGSLPDILTFASDLAQSGELPGLKPTMVTEMKLAGNRDGELYRLLLVAQCNALSAAMPFLFERIDDETELLLPDNLLRTDSVIAKLVAAIEEEDWKEVEIIGWLYQFYISEKKDEVIGKVVKSEDIPAATQLFTPNWIVQYLVQNSVGRLWLMANPTSTLRAQWPYYIEPAQQTTVVQAQLDALIQTRMVEDGGSLNPESITLLDPACGSGHILVEAYEVLKAIYLERGYQPRAIPRLILENNLYGLDIDDRAAQMAGFALLMKARADDHRLFNEPVKLNVLALQESKGLDADVLTRALQAVAGRANSQVDASISTSEFGATDLFPGTRPQMTLGDSVAPGMVGDQARPAISALIATFSQAKTFGSLIQIPQSLTVQLTGMAERLRAALRHGDLYAKAAAQDLWPLVAQARVLGMRFDAVVANPPYMGGKGMAPSLKLYANQNYARCRPDLYAMFVERAAIFAKTDGGNVAFVTMHSWMFLPSFESFRLWLIDNGVILNMAHLGARAFSEISGEVVQSTAFTYMTHKVSQYHPTFINATGGEEEQKKRIILTAKSRISHICQSDFMKIPGSPIAYWVTSAVAKTFGGKRLQDFAEIRAGIGTSNNDRFLRLWHEVNFNRIGFGYSNLQAAGDSKYKWFPYTKGGRFRRWYGNNEFLVNWEGDGRDIKFAVVNNPSDPDTTHWSRRIFNTEYFFLPSLTWSDIGGGLLSVRKNTIGFIHDAVGVGAYRIHESVEWEVLAILNSCIAKVFVDILCPTLHFKPGQMGEIPIIVSNGKAASNAVECVDLATHDWDSLETSCGFSEFQWASQKFNEGQVGRSWSHWAAYVEVNVKRMQQLEEENNRLFINVYGLQEQLSPEVPESQITLTRADREKDCQRLISYAIGCMMGRYSLDATGLIYAAAGNIGFDATRYTTYPADADGILPLTDELWFEDDAASRVREFLLAVWGVDTLTENMAWLAESLGAKASETADEAIRRYLTDKFYKDHLQTYKKRPIYWLFSSGKQGAFRALVYLHRYHEGTLARLRAEYVVPLTGKIQSRIDMLQKDGENASSTAARNKLAKEVEKLKKKHVELLAYDEQLRHHADMRITLDLDDGVKVNYGKFGDLLAEAKAVTGGAGDD